MNNLKVTSIVPKTILGFVLAALLLTACETENSNETTPQTVATPMATPGSGQVADNTAITLATATEGAVIYFTQDGTEPNTTSVPYSDSNKPVITTGKLTLKAISDKAGMNTSTVLTATYTLAPTNTPPIANAGADQTVTLASDLTVTLDGASSSDPDGSIVSFAWECVGCDKYEGVQTPYTLAEVNSLIKSGNTSTATVDLRKAGVYTFRLTVKDNDGAPATRDVKVTVNPDTKRETATLTFNNPTNLASTLTTTLDFAVISGNLPAGVTYTLTDNLNPPNTWDNTTGYEVSVTPYPTGATGGAVFTQIYKNGITILATQTIRAGVVSIAGNKRFSSLNTVNADNSTTQGIVPVKLSFEAVVAEL